MGHCNYIFPSFGFIVIKKYEFIDTNILLWCIYHIRVYWVYPIYIL